MIYVILGLLAINLVSFVMFATRRFLDSKRYLSGINGIFDELSGIIAIGGSFGAFVAMRIFKRGMDYDFVFKIAIPVSMLVQTFVIGYLFLFDMGIVK